MSSDTAYADPSQEILEPSKRVVFDAHGLTATKHVDKLRIKFPHFRSESQFSELIAGLQNIFEDGHNNIDWVVDISSVSEVPLSLYSVFTSFREQLREGGCDFRLIGLSPEQCPSPSLGVEWLPPEEIDEHPPHS